MIKILGEYLIYTIIVLKIFKVFKRGNYFDTRKKRSFFFFFKILSMGSMYNFNKSPSVKHANGYLNYSSLINNLVLFLLRQLGSLLLISDSRYLFLKF